MNDTQKKILELAGTVDINTIGIRELGRQLGVHPQTAKYHKEQLIKKNMLKRTGAIRASRVEENLLGSADLVTIPFLGSANCGPASRIAGSEPIGELRVSSSLLHTNRLQSLFAVQADGDSMNQATLYSEHIEDGDFVIIDTEKEPKKDDYVLATVDGLANIKRFNPEYNQTGELTRIALLSESTASYEPFFIHPDDEHDGLIAGVAVQVVKKPQ